MKKAPVKRAPRKAVAPPVEPPSIAYAAALEKAMTEAVAPPVAPPVPAWPTRKEFAERLAVTRQRNAILQVPGYLVAAETTSRVQPLFLGGDSGAGKGFMAETIASALGWPLVELKVKSLEKDLADSCRLNTPSVRKVFFLDESAEGEGENDAFLLSLLDTSARKYVTEGGDKEKAWLYNQAEHLFIMASNRGEPNPALVGPEGRFAEITLLPFRGADLAWFIQRSIAKFAPEYRVTFKADCLSILTWLTSGLARNVEGIIAKMGALYAGDTIDGSMIREGARLIVDKKGAPLCCPAGRHPGQIAVLTAIASGEAYRQNVIIAASGFGQRPAEYRKRVHSPLIADGLMTACNGGFCITKAGCALLMEIDRVMEGGAV